MKSIRIGFFKFPFLGKWIALRRLKKMMPLSVLKRHGYIVAKSGSGKSELLKLLLLVIKLRNKRFTPWFSIHPKRTCIVLDPHGDVAHECARQRRFYRDFRRNKGKGNLVFISPKLTPNGFPCLNPFDLAGRRYTGIQLEVLAQNLTSVFTAMLSKGDVRLSLQMKTLLTPMLVTLLTFSRDARRNPTFFDLERFLDDGRNGEFVTFAKNHLEGEGQRRFFAHLFGSQKFQPTKFSLRTKLAGLLNTQMFVELLSREHSTWDFQKLMNSGKTILIDGGKSDLGEEVSEVFGRTVVALAQSYAFLRGNGPKIPTFFIIDEAASFVGEDIKTILTEARKFGLHLILVNQIVKQGGISRNFHDTIMGNTALKIIGSAGDTTKQVMARECETSKDHFDDLRVGTFVIKSDTAKPIKASMPTFWLGNKNAMGAHQWKQLKTSLVARFYRNQRPPKEGDSSNVLRQEIEAERVQIMARGRPQSGNPRPPQFTLSSSN